MAPLSKSRSETIHRKGRTPKNEQFSVAIDSAYSEREQHELARLCELGFVDLYRRAHPGEDAGFNFGFKFSEGGTSRLPRQRTRYELPARRVGGPGLPNGGCPRHRGPGGRDHLSWCPPREAVSALGEPRIAALPRNGRGSRSGRWCQNEIGPDANVARQRVRLCVSHGPSSDRTCTRQIRCVRDAINPRFRHGAGCDHKPIEGPQQRPESLFRCRGPSPSGLRKDGYRTMKRIWTALLLLVAAGCGEEAPTTPMPLVPLPTPAPAPTPEPPKTPTGLHVSDSGADFIEWKWTFVEGVSGYDVQLSLNSVFTDEDEVIARTAEEVTYRITDLGAGESAYLRVRSATSSGEGRVTSAWSAHVAGVTLEPVPEPEPEPESTCDPSTSPDDPNGAEMEMATARGRNGVELDVECDWVDADGVCHMVVFSHEQIRCGEYTEKPCGLFRYYTRNVVRSSDMKLLRRWRNPHPDNPWEPFDAWTFESYEYRYRLFLHPHAHWASEKSDEYDESWSLGEIFLIWISSDTWEREHNLREVYSLVVAPEDEALVDWTFVDIVFRSENSDQCHLAERQ